MAEKNTITLVIGNRNYSSWSLRPWLALRHAGVAFAEKRLALYTDETNAWLAKHAPAGKVPLLINGGATIWESLAICEYVAEGWPTARMWPESPAVRAIARSVATEMHGGFQALRSELPMNVRARRDGIALSERAEKDVQRVTALWKRCRRDYGAGGPWLFGHYTVADAMYAPVVLRFHTYGIPLAERASAYADTVLSDPHLTEWMAAAAAEPERIENFEIGVPAG